MIYKLFIGHNLEYWRKIITKKVDIKIGTKKAIAELSMISYLRNNGETLRNKTI